MLWIYVYSALKFTPSVVVKPRFNQMCLGPESLLPIFPSFTQSKTGALKLGLSVSIDLELIAIHCVHAVLKCIVYK